MISPTLVEKPAERPLLHAPVWALLAEVDNEFFPPLSRRTDTQSVRSHPRGAAPDLRAYFNAILAESWLVAHDQGSVIGLLSFRISRDDPLLSDWSPSLHATTVAVAAGARRSGIATGLYEALTHVAREGSVAYLTTRTWTTNTSHNRMLLDRGFRQVRLLANDRAESIGTVYFARAVLAHWMCAENRAEVRPKDKLGSPVDARLRCGQARSATERAMKRDRVTSRSTHSAED